MSYDLDLTLLMRLEGFNLSRYNSLDEQLRLNHFKTIFRQTKVHHVPVTSVTIDDCDKIARLDTPHDATSPAHIKIEK